MMTKRVLYSELRRNDAQLADDLDVIYREALVIWGEQYLRPYTAHGKAHIDQVERNLDSLTHGLQASEVALTSSEIFVLLAACYLHDIGMQLDDPEARAKHAEYAYDLILNSHAQIGTGTRRVTLSINDGNARRAIAHVARAHWTQFALELKSEDYINDNAQRGRYRLLGVTLATADLLDLSPIRARYFHTAHRLYDLAPVSELHQTMHNLVRGFQIVPAMQLGGDLQFQLEWNNDSDVTHKISAWVMKWFHSQWQILNPILYASSGATIRWKTPWTTIVFNAPEGPMPVLSAAALNVLAAEQAEQTRIDRDDFVSHFRRSTTNGEAIVFLLPNDSDFDGPFMSEWCEAHARLHEHCQIGRVAVSLTDPTDVADIVAQLMEQWGQHLPKCDNHDALMKLKTHINANQNKSFISIVILDEYDEKSMSGLLNALVQLPKSTPGLFRICVLLTPEANGPKKLDSGTVIRFGKTPLEADDIKKYLQNSWGYSENESQIIYAKMARLGFTRKPAKVYSYIEVHCEIPSVTDYS